MPCEQEPDADAAAPFEDAHEPPMPAATADTPDAFETPARCGHAPEALAVIAAFDALCAAVGELWEEKRKAAENAERVKGRS